MLLNTSSFKGSSPLASPYTWQKMNWLVSLLYVYIQCFTSLLLHSPMQVFINMHKWKCQRQKQRLDVLVLNKDHHLNLSMTPQDSLQNSQYIHNTICSFYSKMALLCLVEYIFFLMWPGFLETPKVLAPGGLCYLYQRHNLKLLGHNAKPVTGTSFTICHNTGVFLCFIRASGCNCSMVTYIAMSLISGTSKVMIAAKREQCL